MTALQIQYRSLKEQERSNRANEALKSAQNVETIRSNQAKEQEAYRMGTETIRHNKAQDILQGTKNVSDAIGKILDVVGKGPQIVPWFMK